MLKLNLYHAENKKINPGESWKNLGENIHPDSDTRICSKQNELENHTNYYETKSDKEITIKKKKNKGHLRYTQANKTKEIHMCWSGNSG